MPKLACVFLVTLMTACSVDNVDGVFGNPQSNGGATGDGGSQSSQNGTSGNGGDVNGPSVTNGPGNTATNGPTTTGPTTTDGPSTSTGPDPGGVELYCANEPCDGGDVCCYYQFSKGQDFCAAPGQCPGQDGWFEIGCNGPADCATGHCCGKWNNQVGWFEVQCASSCGDDFEMCFDDPGVCNGGNCTGSQALGQGYSYCE